MAKKKEDEKALSAIERLYDKYSKTESVYIPPKKIEDIDPSVQRIKTPFMSFDRYLGGGPAMGKITTYSAMASMGKTSLALALAGANPDKTIGFLDCEYNWEPSSYLWIKKYFGIEKERIHVLQPTYLEEGAEMIEDLCEVSDIVIYDGFDAISPKGEYQEGMEANSMGLQARAYKKFFRRSMGKIYKSKAALIITNHLYENIGNVYEPFKEPGGKAIEDFASQKLFLTRGNIKDSKTNEIVGQSVNINIKKDKLTGNRGKKFTLHYDNKDGFDVIMDVVENAVDLEVIDKNGSWFSYDGSKLGQGAAGVKTLLKDNPELYEEIISECKKRFQ